MFNLRESEDGTPLPIAEVIQRVVAIASGGFAATCVVLLAAMLSLDPHRLDIRLHNALVFLAIALPLLIQSAVLAYAKVAAMVANILLLAGTCCLVSALTLAFTHLDPTAGNVFTLVIVLSAMLVTFLFGREIDKSAKRRDTAISQLRAAGLRQAEDEPQEAAGQSSRQAGAQADDAL